MQHSMCIQTTSDNRPAGGPGVRNHHDVVFTGVNEMSQLYKLDEKQSVGSTVKTLI